MDDYYPNPIIADTKEIEINLKNLPCIQKEIRAEDNTFYNLKIYKSNQSIIFNIIQSDNWEINYKN